MRGKLLFLFVALLCVIFAISINAATTNEFADTAEKLDGISLDGMSSDTVSKVVLVHTEGENTIYTTYPAQYIVKSNETLSFDFTKISGAGGPTYTSSSIVRIQIPSNVTAINEGALNGKTGLLELDFSNTTQQLGLGHNCFKGCTGLTNVYLPDNIYFPTGNNNYQFSECSNIVSARLPSRASRIPAGFFNSCTKLTTLENFPVGVTEVGATAFAGCSALEATIDLPDLKTVGNRAFRYCSKLSFTNLNQLEYVDGDAFQGASKLTSVTFGPNLTLIGNYAFNGANISYIKFNGGNFTIGANTFGAVNYEGPLDLSGCTSVGSNAFFGSHFTSVNLGNDMLTVGQNAFKGCSKMTSLNLGAKLQTIDGYAFADCSALKTVYVSDTITSFGGSAFNNTGSNRITYVTSKDSTYLETVKSAFSASSIISFDTFVPENNTTGKHVVSGVNKCLAFYNNKHTVTNGNCMEDDTCKICALPVEGQAEHNIVEKLVYPNGFTQAGVYTCDCIFNGCTVIDIKAGDEGSEAAALFNGGEGFSTKGDDGIAGGYTIDVDAVEKYKEINGSLTMGIMVVNPNYYYGKDSFFDATGKVNTTGGAIQVELVDNQYKNVSVAITGFTGNAESVSLVIALYAYEDVENVEFIQSSTTACGDKNVTVGGKTLYTVTLASVKAGNSDLSNLGDYEIPKKDEE